MTPESDRIDGWKSIAAYLDKSIRTVQKWADEDALPVRKLGGGVFAYKSELDRWVRNGAGVAVAEVPLRTRSGRFPIWIGAVGFGIAVIAVVAWWYLSRPGPPVDYRVDGAILRTFDARGRVVWEFRLPEAPHTAHYIEDPQQHGESGLFADLEGDGKQELLFDFFPDRGGASSILYCFRFDGSVAWTTSIGAPVTTVNGATILPHYVISRLALLKHPRADGGRIVVGSHHDFSPAYQVAVLTSAGKQVAEYWHPGWFFTVAVADLDNDGHDEILLGGVNNGFRNLGYGATLVILDAEHVSGQGRSPEGDTLHPLRGVGAGEEAAVLLFPEFAKDSDPNIFCFVVDVKVVRGNVEIKIKNGSPDTPFVHYQFDRHLRIASINPDARLEQFFAGVTPADRAVQAQKDLARIRVLRNRFAGTPR